MRVVIPVFVAALLAVGGILGVPRDAEALRIDRYGDVNCDGPTDSVDAQLILQQSAGFVEKLRCDFRGDVSGDGALDAVDATIILQWIAGLLETLPP